MADTKGTCIERKAMIANIQKYNMYDGPGIRTTIFFQGCPLRCKWCANPETFQKKYQVMYKESACVHCGACAKVCPVAIHTMEAGGKRHNLNRDIECIGCRKCEQVCLQKALSIVGEMKTITELLELVEEDAMFYRTSGGGVTLGGGEVLMQPEAAANLLMMCKNEGINTAVDTSGYAKLESILKVAEFTDLFLFDLKHIDPERHFELTGVRNETIIQNLKELLSRRYKVRIRLPLVKGLNDSDRDISGITEFLMPYRDMKNFMGIDILPYHKFGISKYQHLGMEYPLKGEHSFSDPDLKRVEEIFLKHGFQVNIVRH